MRSHWTRISFLIILPLLLFLVMQEQISWRPRTLFIGSSSFKLAFSPDNQMLIVGSDVYLWSGLPHNFQLWSASLGKLQQILPETKSRLAMATFAPSQKVVAGVVSPGVVKLWYVQTGKPERTLLKPISEGVTTTSIAFSPDSKILAEGRGDGGNYTPPYSGTVLLWDTQTGTVQHTLYTGGNTVHSFYFSPDGKILIGSGNYAVQIWDIQSGALLRKFKDKTWFNLELAVSPDGKVLAGVENSLNSLKPIMLWDIKTGALKRQLSLPQVRGFGVSFNGTRRVSSIVFDPEGKILASVSNETGLPPPPPGSNSFIYSGPGVPVNGEVTLWDTHTGAYLRTLTNYGKSMSLVAFSPNGRTIAAGSDHEVIIWEIGTGKLLRELSGHRKDITSLAFTSDGCALATGSEDQTAKLWRIK